MHHIHGRNVDIDQAVEYAEGRRSRSTAAPLKRGVQRCDNGTGREGWAATLQVAAAQDHPARRGVYRWQRSVGAPSHFVQRLIPCIEDRGSAECQSGGRATCAGADCDALCVLQMLLQSWTSNQLQCSLTFKTAAPAARCLRQVPCASRWQPIPAVHCRYTVCRVAAKHEDIERPHQDSQSRTYDGTVSKCLDEVSGEKETFADPSALCMRLLHAQWLHISVLTNLSGHLNTVKKGRKDGTRFLQVFLWCMCRHLNCTWDGCRHI